MVIAETVIAAVAAVVAAENTNQPLFILYDILSCIVFVAMRLFSLYSDFFIDEYYRRNF